MEYTKYLIAVPTMDTMLVPFVASLTYLTRVGLSRVSFASNSLVYDARNLLAAEAIDTGAERVLWLDSDMQFNPDLMERLAHDMDLEGLDYVSGIFFRRRLPVVPVIAKRIEAEKDEKGKLVANTETYLDYPQDSLFEVAATGFGAVMCSTKMLKDVFDVYDRPFDPIPGVLGEDYAFCYRARSLGYRLWCDSRVKVGHVGLLAYGENAYTRPEPQY